jgi:hypothetical protein
MIVCTGCGTKNEDAAHACAKCGRKLQSRWAAPAQGNGQNGQPGSKLAQLAEPVWQAIEPIVHGFDESAGRLVRAAAETWLYALILIAGVLVYAGTEDWRFLAGSVALAAVLAKVRGV